MGFPIDLYQKPEINNDLLYLSYIVSDNVAKIDKSSEELVVIPRIQDKSLYNTVLMSFTTYLEFYRGLVVEGEYKNEIEYFKVRFNSLSFITAHDLYNKLRDKKVEEEIDYTSESCEVGIKANILAILKGVDYAPDTIADFYKKYNNKTKYKKLIKEAKNVKFTQ